MSAEEPQRREDTATQDVDWDAVEEAGERSSGLHLPRSGPRLWGLVGGTLAVVALCLVAVWFGLSATRGVVTWVDTGFQQTSDSTIDVRFDLRREPDRAVTCRLVAQEMSHQIVGRTEVTVPPSESSPSRHVETIRTAGPAVAAMVETCWYTDEGPKE